MERAVVLLVIEPEYHVSFAVAIPVGQCADSQCQIGVTIARCLRQRTPVGLALHTPLPLGTQLHSLHLCGIESGGRCRGAVELVMCGDELEFPPSLGSLVGCYRCLGHLQREAILGHTIKCIVPHSGWDGCFTHEAADAGAPFECTGTDGAYVLSQLESADAAASVKGATVYILHAFGQLDYVCHVIEAGESSTQNPLSAFGNDDVAEL